MTPFTEDTVEQAALEWLHDRGYRIAHGPDIAPDQPAAERTSYAEVVLVDRLRAALARLNPELPAPALEDAFRRLTRPDRPSLVANNHALHRLIVDGVNVEYSHGDGRIAGAQVRVLDYDDPDNNDWLAANQFTVVEAGKNRRPDIVLFVNGLPLVVIELKNAADEKADIWQAFRQLQTYKAEIPSLLAYNAALIISDGTYARLGTLTAGREWFLPWKTIEGDTVIESGRPQLAVLLAGAFEKRRFLDLLRYFIVFEDDGAGELSKKTAAYHQYHAVNAALEETLRASVLGGGVLKEPGGTYRTGRPRDGEPGDRRVGVVWHTQGSGKSLTMAFYAGRVILHPAMGNPTLVVITDRNDLDNQLFGTFARCRDLLRQPPVQAESRADLREKLRVDAGGVVFSTIQKFFPEERGDRHPVLSERRNIVVIADEAHRSQYDFVDGFAANMRDALPNASFVGFTGTPIELSDKNTRAVFGDYISIYDIQRAVTDGATVPIYYESRLAMIALDEAEKPTIDPEFEEITEGEEVEGRERLKTKWAQLEALVGAKKRVDLIAEDLIDHFEKRQQTPELYGGKAMVVTMSRRIAVDLYNAIIKLRPDWQSDAGVADDDKGLIKVVMTGSAADGPEWQPHIRNKARRDELATRFKDAADPFQIVIVRDMWLTGFDAPSLHTMYVDKPMRGHGLMQAIARVNRVFRDKPGGLVVDYIGLADELREALQVYTQSGGTGQTAIDQAEAVRLLQTKYEIVTALFHGFDWSLWTTGTPGQRLGTLPGAQEHILAQRDGKTRLLQYVRELSQAFALAVPHPDALALREDIGFFQAVRAALAKEIAETDGNGRYQTSAEREAAIRQLVSRAIAPGEVIDVFTAAGLPRPDISILDDTFLESVRDLPQKNLAVDLMRRLLSNEIRQQRRKNVVQSRSFEKLLEESIRRYENRARETQEILEELIELAKAMNAAKRRGGELNLTDDELAFYDALEVNDSAVAILGDEELQTIARELVSAVKRNASIDWTLRENVRAHMRVIVKRILRKHGYPPDKQEKATSTVIEQAELLAGEWAVTNIEG
jgi:type I restriction enzyme R subunit